MKSILLYVWQLPQNIVGALLLLYFRSRSDVKKGVYRDVNVYFSNAMRGGISLGRYIFFNQGYTVNEKDLAHEYGHCLQSRRLGLLYLFVVGLPSIIHAAVYRYNSFDPNGYYRYWCEAWADRLGGVKTE